MEYNETIFVRDTGSTAYRVAAGLVREDESFTYNPDNNIYTPVGGESGNDREITIPTFEKYPLRCRLSYLDTYNADSRGDIRFRFTASGSAGSLTERVDESTSEQYQSFAVTCRPVAWYEIVNNIYQGRIDISDISTNPGKQKRRIGEPPVLRRDNQFEFFYDQCEFISTAGKLGTNFDTTNEIKNYIEGKPGNTERGEDEELEYIYDPVNVVYNKKTGEMNLIIHARDFYG